MEKTESDLIEYSSQLLYNRFTHPKHLSVCTLNL